MCLGNICRSPMAEGLFNAKIEKSGLGDSIKSDSAGTSTYHLGKQPDPRTLETLKKHGIIHHHRGRQVDFDDANRFDYIIAMDQYNFQDLKYMIPNGFKGLFLMRNFDHMEKGADVPDPYYGDPDGFEGVYRILDRSLDGLIRYIRDNHNL